MKNLASLTIIPDVSPAGDIAHHATWKQRARGRQADGPNIIRKGYRVGESHQCQILALVGVSVPGRDHHLAHAMRCLVRVEAIQLVPASVDNVTAHVGWTERRERVTE